MENQKDNQPTTVHMTCKNPKCDCIQAVEIPLPNSKTSRLYRCVKCNTTRGAVVGGNISLNDI